ncbi:MAG: leucine-rich repeat protein, partial [Clostridia bacterium]|nr:leucine-rich repeat protein [Clostridia bacterium]
MKKKILLVLSIVAVLACLFAITVSAETALKPQDTNAYGELSFFDESISVGRTNTKNGFTPYIDEAGTTYARVVMGDGTTFYTFPAAYVLSETTIYGTSGHNLYCPSFDSLNTAMESSTGVNPKWTKENVYRIELPYTVNRLNAGSQNFAGYTNVVEITLQPNSSMQDKNSTMVFWKCNNLETINNLENFTFRDGCLGGTFQNCYKLTNITIGYSPEVTKFGDNTFSGCSSLVSVNLGEAFPNAQSLGGSGVFQNCTSLTTLDISKLENLTSIGKFCFSGCTALKTIISSGVNQEGAVIIPEGVTSLGQEVFYNCDSVKYLSLPSTITYLGPSIMRDSTGLEFVDFNENANAINLDNWGHFSGCSGLKAVSLPDGIETINNRFMVSCSNLKAVYLPANLKQMNTNGNGQGPFCFSGNMYFVQEPFEVRDANGYFLGDSFKMPSKPEIYYMPKNLATAGGNASSGTWFRDCFALNNTIVMPEAFKASTVAQMFRGIASSSQQKNVVYRGKITDYCWSEMNKYINFVFAHPENTDISTINFTAFYNRNNENCYFYFCSTGFRYTMAKASADEVAATKEENSYCHIHNPRADKTTEATCTENEKAKTFCFCKFEMSVVEKENTALGHDDTDAVVIMYFADNNYFKNATSEYTCKRCKEAIKSEIANSALFTKKGITAPENSEQPAICHAITVNPNAIDAYNAYLGESNAIKYGVVVGKATASGTPVNIDGTASGNAIVVGFDGTD